MWNSSFQIPRMYKADFRYVLVFANHTSKTDLCFIYKEIKKKDYNFFQLFKILKEWWGFFTAVFILHNFSREF